MKQYNEIKEIIQNELGFTNLQVFQEKCNAEILNRTTPLSREELEKLSPDCVDNRDFWLVADELFVFDPVCSQRGYTTDSFMGANRKNLQFARISGVLGWAEAFLNSRPNSRVLEIGPGFGNFKNYLEVNHVWTKYAGIDVKPRLAEIIQATPEGLIPRALIQKDSFDIVYASNVFQHLSDKQRSQYYKDAYDILKEGGAFIFNLLARRAGKPAVQGPFDEQGNPYICHYGQYTRVPIQDEVINELLDLGFKLVTYQVRPEDSLFSVALSK